MSSEQVIAEELRDHAADLDRCALVFETSDFAEAFAATALELRVAANENRGRADQLLAIAEAVERDALRYRWIRQAGAWESEIGMSLMTPEEMDAAIDGLLAIGEDGNG